MVRKPTTRGAPPGSHALAKAGHGDESRTSLSENPQGVGGRMRELTTPFLSRRIQRSTTETTKQTDRGSGGITCLSNVVPSFATAPRTMRVMAIWRRFETGHNPATFPCSCFDGGFNARRRADYLQWLRRAEAIPISIQIAAQTFHTKRNDHVEEPSELFKAERIRVRHNIKTVVNDSTGSHVGCTGEGHREVV